MQHYQVTLRKLSWPKLNLCYNQHFLRYKILSYNFLFSISNVFPFAFQIAIKKAKYTRKNTKQLLLRKKLAFVVATTSMTTSIGANKDWQAYVELLDPRHVIPGKNALAKDILSLFKQAKKVVKAQVLNAVSKPNMTADIWTKPGMSSSYLGNETNLLYEI